MQKIAQYAETVMKTAWDKRAAAHTTATATFTAAAAATTAAPVNADDRGIALLAPAVVTLASVCPCTDYPTALVQLLLQQIEVQATCVSSYTSTADLLCSSNKNYLTQTIWQFSRKSCVAGASSAVVNGLQLK
jgi:hypothetical protein